MSVDAAAFPNLARWQRFHSGDPDFDQGFREYARSTNEERQARYQLEFLDPEEFYADTDEDHTAPCDPALTDALAAEYAPLLSALDGWLAAWAAALEGIKC
jgi:hypothetical protein